MKIQKGFAPFTVVIILAVVMAIGIAVIVVEKQTPRAAPAPENISSAYRNEEFGFSFSLPSSWENYTIVKGIREVREIASGKAIANAPTIFIRHPKWSAQNPYQDIPIDIYTEDEWKGIIEERYLVSAAPIPPTELGHNSKYVFALPARYNYAFLTGWQEIEKILLGKPLTTFEPLASVDTSLLENLPQ